MRRWIIAFVISWILLVVLGITISTQFVLASLTDLGLDIGFTTRLTTTIGDIQGMAPLYGIIFGGGFLGAMLAATAVAGLISLPRGLVFAVAGAVAMGVTLWALRFTFDVTVMSGARTTMGVLAQCGVGALVGLIFARAAYASNDA